MFKNKEYVYEVYKEKSFSKAAKNLYVTQPCLSAMVKKIENKFGMPIFNRNTNPIQLTECGIEYINCVEQIIQLEERFESYLNDVRGLKSGKISIGANNVCSSFVLPKIIKKFSDKYPEIKIELHEGNVLYLDEQLKKGALDLVLDNYPVDSSIYEKRKLCDEKLLISVPDSIKIDKKWKKYRLTREDIIQNKHLNDEYKELPMEVFKECHFIILCKGNDTRNKFDQLCNESNFSPNIILEVDQLATAYNIVCSNMGITLVSDTLVKNMPILNNLSYYNIYSSLADRELFFHYSKTKYITLAMKQFIESAINIY